MLNKSKKRNIMPAIITTITTFMLLSLIANSINATTYTIDNDSIAQGYSNTNYGFSYYSSSTCYNGDYRISGTVYDNNFYMWNHPPITTSSDYNATIYTYLAHSSFTDPNAEYYAVTGYTAGALVGRINQNIAPNGWNYVGTRKIYRHYSQMTGADGIIITYN